MSTVRSDRSRLTRLARIGEGAALLGILMIVGWLGYAWFDGETARAQLLRALPDGASATPGSGALNFAWVVSMVPAALFVAALWLLRGLFRSLGSGTMFDSEVQSLLRRLGWTALLVAAAGIVARTVAILILTWNNAPGQRQLALGISSTDIAALLVGVLMLALALVFEEALRIEEENRSIV